MRSWWIVVLLLIVQGTTTLPLQAQSWSADRDRPALWQIISLDATGAADWPYGEEDVAGDGLDQFNAEEAAVDLRSVYADADANRFWLRAYVALESTPSTDVVVFVFIDTDSEETTGGTAAATEIWADFDDDPTDGGYERAVGLSGDGTLIGVWRWNEVNSNWTTQPNQAGEVNVEVGIDQDPILIAGERHGYFQVDADHQITELTASCDATIFVRLWYDDSPDNSFGDDDTDAWACRVVTNANGDPVVLHTTECTSDADCPAHGICHDGTCYYAYSCNTDDDCPSNETCIDGVCVPVVDTACQDNSDCDGLVCDAGSCVPCSESGARACDSGYLCTPNGVCIPIQDGGTDGGLTPDAGDSGSSRPRDSGTDGGSAPDSRDSGSPGPDVQGGAFHCGVAQRDSGASGGVLFLLICCVLLLKRRDSRQS